MRQTCLIVATALLCGCASVDFDYPKPESHVVMDTEDTFLGQRLAEQASQHPGEAGFFPISDGIEALAARLLLAGRAERPCCQCRGR